MLLGLRERRGGLGVLLACLEISVQHATVAADLLAVADMQPDRQHASSALAKEIGGIARSRGLIRDDFWSNHRLSGSASSTSIARSSGNSFSRSSRGSIVRACTNALVHSKAAPLG